MLVLFKPELFDKGTCAIYSNLFTSFSIHFNFRNYLFESNILVELGLIFCHLQLKAYMIIRFQNGTSVKVGDKLTIPLG